MDVPDAAHGFDRAADDYERGRPGYPPEVVERLVEVCDIGHRSRILDLAAGTGKLTRELVTTGARVVAVEPSPGMRRQLAVMCPDAEVLDGTAEAIPVGDESVDALTVAQAFHWFDPGRALREIRRVLRPGGGLVMVWNRRDESEPWVAEMSRLTHWHERPASNYETTDWLAVVAADGGFTTVTHEQHRWAHQITRAALGDRVRSISYIAAAEADQRERIVGQVLEVVAGLDEPFPLPYVTHLYWCRRS